MRVGEIELGVLSFPHPIPKISRFSSGHKKSLNLASGFLLQVAPCPLPEPTSSAQTFLRGLDFVTVSSPLVLPGHYTITSERGKTGRQEVGHWVTRVSWGVCWDTGRGNTLRRLPTTPQVPQKKLAQDVSEYSPISPDRWCLSNLGGRGPASRVLCAWVMYSVWVMRPDVL